MYRVAHKKWTISFRCLQRVHHGFVYSADADFIYYIEKLLTVYLKLYKPKL